MFVHGHSFRRQAVICDVLVLRHALHAVVSEVDNKSSGYFTNLYKFEAIFVQ